MAILISLFVFFIPYSVWHLHQLLKRKLVRELIAVAVLSSLAVAYLLSLAFGFSMPSLDETYRLLYAPVSDYVLRKTLGISTGEG